MRFNIDDKRENAFRDGIIGGLLIIFGTVYNIYILSEYWSLSTTPQNDMVMGLVILAFGLASGIIGILGAIISRKESRTKTAGIFMIISAFGGLLTIAPLSYATIFFAIPKMIATLLLISAASSVLGHSGTKKRPTPQPS